MLGMKNTMGLMLLMVVGLSQAAPQISTSDVVTTVTTQLQPLISKAVADALAATSSFQTRRPTSFTAPTIRTVVEEPTAPAAYQYSYKVSDEDDQAALIQLIISQLQPSISSAVQSAISSRQTA